MTNTIFNIFFFTELEISMKLEGKRAKFRTTPTSYRSLHMCCRQLTGLLLYQYFSPLCITKSTLQPLRVIWVKIVLH